MIPRQVKLMSLRLITAFIIDIKKLKLIGTVWRTSRQAYLSRWERHLAGFPKFSVRQMICNSLASSLHSIRRYLAKKHEFSVRQCSLPSVVAQSNESLANRGRSCLEKPQFLHRYHTVSLLFFFAYDFHSCGSRISFPPGRSCL